MDNKLEVGITVSFLNEVGNGKVIKILNNHQALILKEDGFEDVYNIKELIIVSYRNTYRSCLQIYPY